MERKGAGKFNLSTDGEAADLESQEFHPAERGRSGDLGLRNKGTEGGAAACWPPATDKGLVGVPAVIWSGCTFSSGPGSWLVGNAVWFRELQGEPSGPSQPGGHKQMVVSFCPGPGIPPSETPQGNTGHQVVIRGRSGDESSLS